jgi:hypothetical protein
LRERLGVGPGAGAAWPGLWSACAVPALPSAAIPTMPINDMSFFTVFSRSIITQSHPATVR